MQFIWKEHSEHLERENMVFHAVLCISVVTLSARDSQKLTKPLSKGFERSVYWNEY